MISFPLHIMFKLLKWSVVTAAILAYVEIGPGGEALGEIVNVMKQAMLEVDWQSIASNITSQLKIVATNIVSPMQTKV